MNALNWELLGFLFQHFLVLSLLAIGGATSVAPDMHRLLVVQHGLMSDAQFTASIAIAQAAPGPNLLFVAVLGYQLAGLPGAAVTMIAMLAPSTLLTLAVTRWSQARAEQRAVQAFKIGLAPLTLALFVATGWLLALPGGSWQAYALTAGAAVLVWRTRIHLLWLIAGGAAVGMAGWV